MLGIMDSAAIKTFIFAGNATFTLESVATGTHFTYKVKASKDSRVHFASVLTNPDTYTYAGLLSARGLSATHNSKIGAAAPSFRGLDWFMRNLDSEQVKFRHAGCCGRCGRQLTTPESIDRGLGADCAAMMGL